MKILQVIDTLEPGGAEQMAVNYANSLDDYEEESYLCCTRREGTLKAKLGVRVKYLFLNKSSTFDITAFKKLKKFISENKIDIVHAHSSSYFLITIIKILGSNKFKLVWHDHYGNSEFLKNRPTALLRFCSIYFDGILSVNSKLQTWARENLHCEKVETFRNFLVQDKSILSKEDEVILKGGNDFKYICVANLRPQKDHLNLVKAFEMLDLKNISLHLIGKNFKDDYFQSVIKAINDSSKKDKIYYYGSVDNIPSVLRQADVGVLASKSEGLPLAIIEYGLAGLSIICTEVGELKNLLGDDGLIVEPENSKELSDKMNYIYHNSYVRLDHNRNFQSKIKSEFLASKVITKVIRFYREL